MRRALPGYDAAAHAGALRHFQRAIASRYGLTTMHEAGAYPEEPVFDAYRLLEERGELAARYCISLQLDPDRPVGEQVAAAVEERARCAARSCARAAVKLFVDGVIESHTGYLKEPYADRSGYRGEPVWAPERLIEASVASRPRAFSSTITPSATPPSR